jgi:hypothetical protein
MYWKDLCRELLVDRCEWELILSEGDYSTKGEKGKNKEEKSKPSCVMIIGKTHNKRRTR